MDKVFSARLDEAVVDKMNRLARRLRITKRQFLEEPIRSRAQQVDRESIRPREHYRSGSPCRLQVIARRSRRWYTSGYEDSRTN